MKFQAKVLYVLITAAVFFTCDDVDLTGEDIGEVQGFWQMHEAITGTNTFVLISDNEFNFYYYDGWKNCITKDKHTVIDIDPQGFYTVRAPGSDVNEVYAISRSGERIHLRDIDKTQSELDKFFPSEVNIETFAPECFLEEVAGIWELDSVDEEEYLFLSEELIIATVFLPAPDSCYGAIGYNVLNIDGPDMTIRNRQDVQDSLAINVMVADSILTVQVFEDGDTATETNLYRRSSITEDDLQPVCTIQTDTAPGIK